MIRVVLLGTNQQNFTQLLYNYLGKYSSFDIISPKTPPQKNSPFELKCNKTTPFHFLAALFLNLTSKVFWQLLFFIFFIEFNLPKGLYFIFIFTKERALFLANNNFKDYDFFHFNYIQYSYVREAFFLNKDQKIVCSFWGSDLLRTDDSFNHFIVKKALSRATVITCQSIELKQIILAKYGRDFDEKITVTNFPLNTEVLELIDKYKKSPEKIGAFKANYNYHLRKKIIQIGHNGNPLNNHFEIIAHLPKELNNNYHIVINLNYAINQSEVDSYKEKLQSKLDEKGYSYTILEKFFSKEELALSRLSSDIFIHLPKSDALSGTLFEMFYANNQVITWSWLPYETFKDIGVNLNEITYFDELENIIQNLKSAEPQINTLEEINYQLTSGWRDIYEISNS